MYKISLTLTLLTALLLTSLTAYFRFGGWMYTLFVLTNQNHCYMPKLNDFLISSPVLLYDLGHHPFLGVEFLTSYPVLVYNEIN